jgi:hypothetical protein
MMGPDYTQSHGFYEVAKTFYTEFIPEAEALLPGVSEDVMKSPYHQWTKGPEQRTATQKLSARHRMRGSPQMVIALRFPNE